MADPTPPHFPPSSPGTPPPSGPKLRRPVYEPSLLPARKRRRASRWVMLPALLVALGGALYLVLIVPHQRRFVPTAGQIVYASDAGSPGHARLWLSGADGGSPKLLPGTQGDISAPVFSPDGSQVAFLASAGGNPQVFVTDADGQNAQQVTRNAGAKQQPAFAFASSVLLAYLSGGVLSTVDTVTGDTSLLLPPSTGTTRPQNGDALINSPSVIIGRFAWAPAPGLDTQGLAAVEATADVQALVVLPTLSGRARDTQTDQPNSPPLAAADTLTLGWSPTGNLLAVAMMGIKGLPPGRQLSAIALFDREGNPAGSRPLALTQSASLGPQNPVFSPDGSTLCFELWQMPDLAHARCLGVYSVPTDGSQPPHRLVAGDAEQVRFAPDGGHLLFLRARPGGGHDLYSAPVSGGAASRLSAEVADVTGFDVSPQGQSTRH